MIDPGNIPSRTAIIQNWIANTMRGNPRLTYDEAFRMASQDDELKPLFAAMHRPGRTVSDDAPAARSSTSSDGKNPGAIAGADMSTKALQKQPDPGSYNKDDGMPDGFAAGPGLNALRAARFKK
jgi:hypothetical protein